MVVRENLYNLDKRLLQPMRMFFQTQAAGGVLLIVATVLAMIAANSGLKDWYFSLWDYKIAFSIGGIFEIEKSFHYAINDGLMAMFFFVLGLEIKREIIAGELSSIRKAMLPIIAAVGGMVVPASVYLLFNQGSEGAAGWGVPMATDIAFSLGILSMISRHVPISLKVFLVALAVVDDLGAVMVIALFYSSDISMMSIAIGLVLLVVMYLGNVLGIRHWLFYALIGICGLWLAFLLSGVHATIAGVLAAFVIPAKSTYSTRELVSYLDMVMGDLRNCGEKNKEILSHQQQKLVDALKRGIYSYEPPMQKLEHALHPLVIFLVLPLFAFSNAGVYIEGNIFETLSHPVSLGVICGLFFGKSIGIALFAWFAIKLKWASLPKDVTWPMIIGVAFLGGIGFTMSIFISGLAFYNNMELINESKIGIIAGSLIAGIVGFIILKLTIKPRPIEHSIQTVPEDQEVIHSF